MGTRSRAADSGSASCPSRHSGGIPVPPWDWRDMHAPINHSCIILHICKHRVRTELTGDTSLLINSDGPSMQNDMVLTGNFAFKRLEP
jgi:hypothetical protein